MKRLPALLIFLACATAAQAQSALELHAGPELAVRPDSYSRLYPIAAEVGVRYNAPVSERWRLTARGGYGYANARGEDRAHLDVWTFGVGLRLHPDDVGADDYVGVELGVRSMRADGVGLRGERVISETVRYLSGRIYLGFMFPAWRDYIAVEPAASVFAVDGTPHISVSLQVVLPIW